MTNRVVRTAPELRDEAKSRFTRRLAHEAHLEQRTPPDLLAAELLVILDTCQIQLKDGRIHTALAGTPAADLPADNPYRAAREALKGNQQ
jgi:hypothetical protein